MRPHTICHMVTSIDGRTLGSRWAPGGIDMGEAPEVARFAHGPVQGRGLEVDFGDNLVHKLERLAAHAVPLVNYGDNG
mgnify:CR=1 FL=1